MNYIHRNPVVKVTKVLTTGFGPFDGVTPNIGDYVVTDVLGYEHVLTEAQLLRHFKPKPVDQEDQTKEIRLALLSIIENEHMVTDDNAENLLFACIDDAKRILTMLK